MALSRTTLTTTKTVSAAASLTTSSVTLSTGDLLVVAVGYSKFSTAQDVTGVTWNGVALTKAAEQPGGQGGGQQAAWHGCSIWYLKVTSGASATVVITCAGSNDHIRAAVLKYTGHDTTTPIGDTDNAFENQTTATEPSLTLTTVSGDQVIDVLQLENGGGNPTIGADQTSIYQTDDGTNNYATSISVEAAVGISTTMSWARSVSQRGYTYCAAVITAAAGGGGGGSKLLLRLLTEE